MDEDKFNKQKGTEDFRTDRVRIVTDKTGKVSCAPRMG